MLNLFSETIKHTIQAMIYLATYDNQRVMVSQIAEYYDIPKFYLAKLMQTLTKHHLVKSTRGRTGGVKLNKPAKDIRIIDIIRAIDGPTPEHEVCVFGLDICSDSVPCPVHDIWKNMKENIKNELYHQNLENLSIELDKKHKLLDTD